MLTILRTDSTSSLLAMGGGGGGGKSYIVCSGDTLYWNKILQVNNPASIPCKIFMITNLRQKQKPLKKLYYQMLLLPKRL